MINGQSFHVIKKDVLEMIPYIEKLPKLERAMLSNWVQGFLNHTQMSQIEKKESEENEQK